MKKLIYIFSAIAVLILYSCEPQFDEAPDIGNPPTAEIILTAIDDNHYLVTAKTDNGFLFNWDFGTGVKSQQETDTAYYPFAGEYTLKLTVSGKGGATTVTKNITVEKTDPAISTLPGIKELTNSGEGRVWVFAKENDVYENDNGDPAFFFMTANYDWDEFWWDPVADECCQAEAIADDSIKFDLDGAFNYTVWHNGEAKKGNFIYDNDAKTLKLIGANLPYFEINEDEGLLDQDVFATAVFLVKDLSDDLISFWQDQSAMHPDDYDYGWTWVFSPKKQ